MSSSPLTRNPRTKSRPTAARTARITSTEKRSRFSKLPPYSSVRRFTDGTQNWSIRWRAKAQRSAPSNPARWRRRAAAAYAWTISAISPRSSACGISRFSVSGTSEADTRGRSPGPEKPRRPRCVIWDMTHAPSPWIACANASNMGSDESSQFLIPFQSRTGLDGWTLELPKHWTSPAPPRAFSWW